MKRTIIAASIAALPMLLGVSAVHTEQPKACSTTEALISDGGFVLQADGRVANAPPPQPFTMNGLALAS
jgi:hypothetical protein